MPEMIKTKAQTLAQTYKHWIGQEYVCPEDGNTYRITADDVADICEVSVGYAYQEERVKAIHCACGGYAYVDSDYRGDKNVQHIAPKHYSIYDR